MNENQAREAYAAQLLLEREQYLSRRVRASSDFQVASQSEEGDKAFQNALFHAKRRDKVYQALTRGELIEDMYREEYEQLLPLIQQSLKRDSAIDLPFLRSVAKARVSLKTARDASHLVASGAVSRHLALERHKFISDAARRVEKYLRSADLTGLIRDPEQVEKIIPHLMETTFARGVPPMVVKYAYRPKLLKTMMYASVRSQYPELQACRAVLMPEGDKINDRVNQEIDQAESAVCASVGKQFSEKRIRGLLHANPHVRRLQRRSDQVFQQEKRLRSALLTAVPEHYRDLYPLARQMRRKFILHLGPTNSGKTFEGVERLRGARHGIYLGPLRLLAAEQFETLNLNDTPCSLVTGEEQIWVPNSRIQSSTVEMANLREMYDVAVIDECQMIGDRDRGGAWTAAILGLCAEEIHACASPDAEGLLTNIILDCGDELTVVRHERMTPLVVEKESFQFPESVRRGDALIVFSKARVHAVAAELKRKGYRVSLIYGALPPDVRHDQAKRFSDGDTDVVVSTDAIAMGMNLPIERVVFLEMEKYDGDITRPLYDSEIKQIAGRAGRYGIYDIGYVNAYGFRGVVQQALSKPLLPLNEAVIGFPESLLGLPLSLTETLREWLRMQDKGCFSKASAVRMQSLAEMMETRHTNKALLYRFLCIPFDEMDSDLLVRWRQMYHAECQHTHVDVVSNLPQYLNPEECTPEMLDGLEEDYRRCDLYYNYARLFLEDPERILLEIQQRKSLISKGIIHILSTQKLQQRACKSCGRPLPWNWPHRLCDACYNRQRGGGGRWRPAQYDF